MQASDKSVRGIAIANVATVALALWQDWPLVLMLWPYWCQSVIIGWFARKRMLALTAFSTDGFTINGQPATPTARTRIGTANFFAMHYGGFHLIYLVFLLVLTAIVIAAPLAPDLVYVPPDVLERADSLRLYDPFLILGLIVGFWFSHRASHREHLAADLQHTPNIASLMFLPYLRVVPMHLTILLAIPLGGTGGILLFGSLKTIADTLMHTAEHRWLRKAKVAGTTIRAGE